jgi:D-beta-D-heptose 7-phosphate kinase/D-beta-D-heptose 1-phosphate adenosyltransferase
VNNDLIKLVDAIANLKVLVIGEAMLDCYLQGFSNRLCPEAPVPVVNVTEQKQVPGGAANTAVNVQALGAKVTFLSVVGDDWYGSILQRSLEEQGVSTKHILTQSSRQTLAKQRVIAADQLLVRFDRGSTEAIDSATEQALIEQLERCFHEVDAVIVSDYGYGILTEKIIGAIALLQQSSPRILIVDSKRLTAYRNANVTAVNLNYSEAVQLLGVSVLDRNYTEQIASYGEKLLDLTNAQIVAVTLDVEGAIAFERNRPPYRTYAQATNHSRATGTGNTFVSALIALASIATTQDAIELALAAAAVVVSSDGTTSCSVQELREYLYRQETGERKQKNSLSLHHSSPFTIPDKYVPDPSSFVARIVSYRASGQRIVFTNGCFDILHAGHVSYLNRARALGDILIIGVNSDVSVSSLKGPTRPINPLLDRILVLAGLSSVDYLIPFDQATPINLIQLIRPDIYVKGGDYTKETLPEASVVEQLGGVVEILPFIENRSTSSIIKRICQAQLAEGSQQGK